MMFLKVFDDFFFPQPLLTLLLCNMLGCLPYNKVMLPTLQSVKLLPSLRVS